MNLRILILCVIIASVVSFYCEKKETSTGPPVIPMPDTTSHDFEWQIDYFGDGGSSRLSDVCIIDENDIWAVGKINLKDSLGQYIYPPYNAVHWDGQIWELKKISTITYYDKIDIIPLTSIFTFNSTEIYVSSSAGAIGNWDGLSWSSQWIEERQGSIKKIWGKSSSDLYLVGSNGSITYYDGLNWQKLDSGTSLDIQDIWGARDPHTGEYTVLAVAGSYSTGKECEVLQINETKVEKISTEGIDRRLGGVWFDPGRIYYAVGVGIYSKESIDDTVRWGGPIFSLTQYTSTAIRGNHVNDVFIVGSYGDILHYNGKSWHSYREELGPIGGFGEVAVKGDLVCAVGYEGSRAIILRGKRIK